MAESEAPVAKPKKSLFKRPAWASNTTTTAIPANSTATRSETPTDLFSRSHNYEEFVEDRERQRRARESKKKGKEECRRSGTNEVKDEGPKAGKRRRISDEDSIDSAGKDSLEKPTKQPARQNSIFSEDDQDIYVPQKSKPKPKSKPKATIIELDDEEDDEEDLNAIALTPKNATTTATETNPDDDLDELYASDPEMLALARKAREKRRREEREESSGAIDPTVKLLITSPMPGTVPLIVSRKLSQRLQEVREAWLSKQTFYPEVAKGIFFTYKLRKVYDVTTCRSLGVRVDYLGRVVADSPGAGLDEHAEKIHIEAVDEEWWQKLKEAKAAPRRNIYLENAKLGAESAEGTPAVDDEAAQEPLIKITLKAKGHADIKTKVRPSTTFAKMVNAARSRFGLSADRQVHLEFDGEKLEPPEGQVKDTDISDLDCIDVHIK